MSWFWPVVGCAVVYLLTYTGLYNFYQDFKNDELKFQPMEVGEKGEQNGR